MARAKAAGRVNCDKDRFAKAEWVTKEVRRIAGLILIIDALPDGPIREWLKVEADRQMAELHGATR